MPNHADSLFENRNDTPIPQEFGLYNRHQTRNPQEFGFFNRHQTRNPRDFGFFNRCASIDSPAFRFGKHSREWNSPVSAVGERCGINSQEEIGFFQPHPKLVPPNSQDGDACREAKSLSLGVPDDCLPMIPAFLANADPIALGETPLSGVASSITRRLISRRSEACIVRVLNRASPFRHFSFFSR